MTEPRLTGRVPADRIRRFDVPRPPPGVIEGLRALDGVTNLVSDILDEMFLARTIPATYLKPTIPGTTIVGPALTVRNVPLPATPFEVIRARHSNSQADAEAHNLSVPGDILVIQGFGDASNIGGMSSMLGKRQGSLGAVVWGCCRDVGHSRKIGYPIWSRGVTPLTGKWRLETAEINGDIRFGDVAVCCGDIVVADDSGVCFIPYARAAEVLDKARARAAVEERRMRMIADGVPISELPRPNIDTGEE
jgi:4-hydroxy-4-methyl-2-oxoglutarate aldolase